MKRLKDPIYGYIDIEDNVMEEIIQLTKDKYLEEEIKIKNYSAAPHELMSVVIALKSFSNLFTDDQERSFFTRCILGYYYERDLTFEKSIYNCMISLLNSSVIDVDKLDYLIRDAYITGFVRGSGKIRSVQLNVI